MKWSWLFTEIRRWLKGRGRNARREKNTASTRADARLGSEITLPAILDADGVDSELDVLVGNCALVEKTTSDSEFEV